VRGRPDQEAAARRAVERLDTHRAARGEAPDLQLACALVRMAVWVKMAAQGATLGEIGTALRRGPPVTMPPLPQARDEEALGSS
jgi:hypothetical protein